MRPAMGRRGLTRVAEARAKLGFTQAELASHTGASLKTIGRIERGECRPRLPLAARLAAVLQVDLEDLITDMLEEAS